jgi:hypothetical protein
MNEPEQKVTETAIETTADDLVEVGDVSTDTKGAFGLFPDGGQGYQNL